LGWLVLCVSFKHMPNITQVTQIPVQLLVSDGDQKESSAYKVLWNNSQIMLDAGKRTEVLHLQERDFRFLQQVIEKAKIRTECHYQIRSLNSHIKGPGKATKESPEPLLSVILYGPFENFEYVGSYAQKCGIFLQDPKDCNYDVPYRNPHRLAPPDDDKPQPDTTMTNSRRRLTVSVEELDRNIDLYANLASDESLPEAEQPMSLVTSLHRYEKHPPNEVE